MSYPSGPPGNSGYQPSPSAPQYGAPAQQYGAPPQQEPAPAGPSKLPFYLDIGVVVLGLAAYFTTFGIDGTAVTALVPAVLAALLAGVGLLPKQNKHIGVVAVIATLGFLVVLAGVVVVGVSSVEWPVYLLLVFSVLQALAAIAALLLDAGIITAPTPKPQYDQGYGQYGAPGGYYGQPQGQPQGPQGSHQDYGQQHGGPQHGGPPQRPPYTQVTQYGGGYSNPNANPNTGGFSSQGHAPTSVISAQSGGAQNHSQNGPPTPPTGFPAFGQPQQTGSAPAQSSESNALTQSFDTSQQQQPAPPSSPPPS